MSDGDATVEVICALSADDALRVMVELRPGMTVGEAIEASQLAVQRPGIKSESYSVGIFHRRVGREFPVTAGDRIEIYRPLMVDPKEARRLRAARRARKEKDKSDGSRASES